MPTHRVTVLLNDAELAKAKRAAGLLPMSAWLRHIAMAEADGERAGLQFTEQRGMFPTKEALAGFKESAEKFERRGERDDGENQVHGVRSGISERGGNDELRSGDGVKSARTAVLDVPRSRHSAKAKQTKAAKGVRGRGGVKEEGSGVCSEAVGPGIYCSKCGKRH